MRSWWIFLSGGFYEILQRNCIAGTESKWSSLLMYFVSPERCKIKDRSLLKYFDCESRKCIS